MSAAGNGWPGCSTTWQWHDCYATLLNECELYGGPILSSFAYDIGIKKSQLPLFTLNPELIILKDNTDVRKLYWLKNVASSARFCCCTGAGEANFISASDSNCLRLEFFLSI